MEVESDIVVIGGGLAGMTAAITAAKQAPDIDVTVVSKKQSTLRQASGHIDVLGYIDDRDEPVINPYKSIHELPSRHPYRLIGVDAVRSAMDLFNEIAEGYMGSHTDHNALLPVLGGLKPTGRYPESMKDGLLSDERNMLLIGFESIPDMNAELVASILRELEVPFEVDGYTIRSPFNLKSDVEVTRYAYLMEQAAKEENRELMGVVNEVKKKIRDTGFDVERVGFPAVLGLHDSSCVIAALSEKLGVSVFEVALPPPSLPGIRLENMLYGSMKQLGVQTVYGNPVVGYESNDGSVESVDVRHSGGSLVRYSAQGFILCTGGLIGKGVNAGREAVNEQVFGFNVNHPENRYNWFSDSQFDNHSFNQFGVEVNQDLRPMDDSGGIDMDNVWLAGSVLGGFDGGAENSSGGVSIVTGYHSAKKALENTGL